MGATTEFVTKIYNEKTTEGAIELIGSDYKDIYERIGRKIINRINQFTYNKIKVHAVMFSMNKGVLWDGRE